MRRASHNRTQSAHEPIEEWGSPEPSQLEGQRVRTSHLRLELHFMERRGQPFHARYRGIPKGNTGFLAAHQHALDPQCTPDHAQECHREHRLRRWRQWSEPVAELRAERLDVLRRLEPRESLVDVELAFL